LGLTIRSGGTGAHPKVCRGAVLSSLMFSITAGVMMLERAKAGIKSRNKVFYDKSD